MAMRDMTIRTIDTSLVPYASDRLRRLRPGRRIETRHIALSGILVASLAAPGIASARSPGGTQAHPPAAAYPAPDQSVLVKRNSRAVQRERAVAGLKAEPQADRILARIYKATIRDTTARLAVAQSPSTHPDATIPTAFLPRDLSRRVHRLPESARRSFLHHMAEAGPDIVHNALATALSDADATLAVLPRNRPLSEMEETTFISSVARRAENEAVRSAAEAAISAVSAPAVQKTQATVRRPRV